MKTSYVNFAIGLLYGFGLGVLLDKSSLVNLTSLSLLIAFLVVVPFTGWLESRNHRRRVETWAQIRERGRFMFILTRFVLLRGGIVAAILMFALRGSIVSGVVHEITVPILVVALAIIGYQEWENCERAFETPFGLRQDLKED